MVAYSLVSIILIALKSSYNKNKLKKTLKTTDAEMLNFNF